MKFSTTSFAITLVAWLAPGNVSARCSSSLTGCYLRDIKTSEESGKTTEVKLTGHDQFEFTDGSSERSIRCDVDGHIDEIEFLFEPEGTKHQSWGAPFWISNSYGDWVEPSQWLEFCGKKTMTVKAKTWSDHCFEESFELVGVCGGSTLGVTDAPTKAPMGKTQTEPSTTAPTASPTAELTGLPTKAPVTSPTTETPTAVITADTKKCSSSLTGCYLRDIKTSKESGKTLEVKLTGYDKFEFVDGSSEHSIRCDVDGHIDEIEFLFEPEGTKHQSWGAPFWISNSFGDWVESSQWLEFCGKKTMAVKAKTWDSGHCFEESFELVGVCGGSTLGVTDAPTKAPAMSPTTEAPTATPTLNPTGKPTVSPTKEPTEAPTDSPTSAPVTMAPSAAPTLSPTDKPTVSPTNDPTEAPTESPTSAPVTMAPTETPVPAVTDVQCSKNDDLYFKETPCLTGLLDEVLLAKECNANKIIAALQAAFTSAQRTGRWGHHRNLGYVAPKTTYYSQTTAGGATGLYPKCPWDFNYELALLTGTLSRNKATMVLQEMCSVAERDSVRNVGTTKWSDIDRRLTPEFMEEYTAGGTDLNHEIGNFQNANKNEDPRLNTYYPTDDFSYTMGISIDSYYRSGGRSSVLAPVEHLAKCEHQTVMCCFGGDRQYDDNNGNCAKTNCDDAKPGDNTDICFANGRRYRGYETAHCHGYSWSNNADDPSAKMKFNNIFYVLMHDHMYNRGYVKSSKYGASMCSCVEKMPIVSRADCSQIDMISNYKLSVNGDGKIVVVVDRVAFEFNACKGYYPGTKWARNNDLLGHVEKLYQEDKMDLATRRAVDKNLVGNCAGAGYRL